MKHIYSLLFSIISVAAFAQIPNSSFENWNSTSFTLPTGWRTFGNVTQATPSTGGAYAVRIERNPADINSPGAIIYGNPDGAVFTGGVPFAARPDSLVANFKYDIPAGDSAWVLFMFKNSGSFISQNLNLVYGSNPSSFIRKAFAVNYFSGLTPDSLIIGFTSTNPDSAFMGGYVIIDDVRFVGASTTIVPNGDFENWTVYTNEEPVSWYTSNMQYITNPVLPVTKTTDSYSGTYAARIENINITSGNQMGFLMAGPQGSTGMEPGFAVSYRDTVFSGHYKFAPLNNDTLTMGVVMFSGGLQVGWGFYQTDTATAVYKSFSTPIYYDFAFLGTPDSATIMAFPFVGGGMPHGNSVMIVDDFAFPAVATSVSSVKIDMSMFVYPNPAVDFTNISYVLQKQSNVIVTIHDVNGKLIDVISNSEQSSGAHVLRYDLSHLSNGMYSVSVEVDGEKQIKKITVQK